MATTLQPAAVTCQGCGDAVDLDAHFCPHCGTRQVPDRPMPVDRRVGEPQRLGRSVLLWMALGLVAAAVLLVTVGILLGRLATSAGEGGDGDGSAAEAMDAYAPIANGWDGKYEHVTDEAAGDDPNGLATAANDARLWIDVNRPDLVDIAAGTGGGAGPLVDQLVGIFDARAAVLADIEATATDGGTGDGAAADELATLASLEAEADATTCRIADVVRAEGDDPDDHVPTGTDAACSPAGVGDAGGDKAAEGDDLGGG